MSNRREANDGLAYWRIYASLGINVLRALTLFQTFEVSLGNWEPSKARPMNIHGPPDRSRHGLWNSPNGTGGSAVWGREIHREEKPPGRLSRIDWPVLAIWCKVVALYLSLHCIVVCVYVDVLFVFAWCYSSFCCCTDITMITWLAMLFTPDLSMFKLTG